ncbi:MAG: hypothetical protein FWH36_02560 [Lentimicrobiaceae bacterium]|nr:hypothetical protein [Lentimicrobiaceae bacterium]
MKKLFALAIVAGMVFVSCGSKPETTEEPIVEDEAIETTVENEDLDAAVMPEEQENAEEVTAVE